jgi:hypothetical protein
MVVVAGAVVGVRQAVGSRVRAFRHQVIIRDGRLAPAVAALRRERIHAPGRWPLAAAHAGIIGLELRPREMHLGNRHQDVASCSQSVYVKKCGQQVLTYLASQVSLLHVTHAVYLVKDLEPLGRAD